MFFTPLLEGNLKDRHLISKIVYYPKTKSTNDDIWELYNSDKQTKLLIISDNQTAGKGRNNNLWFSSPGHNITCSLLLDQLFPRKLINCHALVMPVAIVLAIKKFLLIDLNIKWPNDIIFNKKKLGGILIESRKNNDTYTFNFGIGLNVNETNFPSELKNSSTSLKEIKGHVIQREPLLAFILNELSDLIKKLSTKNIINLWIESCNHINKEISFKYKGERIIGTFEGLDASGMAIIHHNDEIIKYGGEINLL